MGGSFGTRPSTRFEGDESSSFDALGTFFLHPIACRQSPSFGWAYAAAVSDYRAHFGRHRPPEMPIRFTCSTAMCSPSAPVTRRRCRLSHFRTKGRSRTTPASTHSANAPRLRGTAGGRISRHDGHVGAYTRLPLLGPFPLLLAMSGENVWQPVISVAAVAPPSPGPRRGP